MTRKWLKRLRWEVALAALVCGGIVHIAATFLVPHLAKGSAVLQLASDLPINTMRVLPATGAGRQPLPFLTPDMRYAVCKYDISSGPVAVTAVLPDPGWSLGLYTPGGDNFYAVPAQSARRTDVSITLVQPTETGSSFLNFNLGRPARVNASEIAVPQQQGLVVVRAPQRGGAYAPEVEAQLTRATCSAQRS
jgi:uncharacterized membrane protein